MWLGQRETLLLVSQKVQGGGARAVVDTHGVVADAPLQGLVEWGLQAELLHRGRAAAGIPSGGKELPGTGAGAAKLPQAPQTTQRGVVQGVRVVGAGTRVSAADGHRRGGHAEELGLQAGGVLGGDHGGAALVHPLDAFFLHITQHRVEVNRPDEVLVVGDVFGFVWKRKEGRKIRRRRQFR